MLNEETRIALCCQYRLTPVSWRPTALLKDVAMRFSREEENLITDRLEPVKCVQKSSGTIATVHLIYNVY